MKILFFESCKDGTVGGSHTCMFNLIRNLDRSKIQVTAGFYSDNIFTPRYRDLGVKVDILRLPKPLRDGNIILRKALNWYNLEVKSSRHLEDYFRRESFDLVVLNNSICVSLVFARVCKRLGIPLVVYERGFGSFKRKHIEATADIQATISISDAVHRHVMGQDFKTKIIERIYDGIDPDDFRPRRSPAAIKAELAIPPEARVLGIVGNVRPWKGQQYFVEAFRELSRKYGDVYGLIVGGWGADDQAFQSSLVETVRSAGLSRRLQFLGYRADVPDLLSIFDVFVHASTKPEPFGMVLLEAIAGKKPIVATNLGGPTEILEGGESGVLVPPKDGAALAAACGRYLNDPAFAAKKIEHAHDRLFHRFHIRQTVKQTVNLFESIVRGTVPAGAVSCGA